MMSLMKKIVKTTDDESSTTNMSPMKIKVPGSGLSMNSGMTMSKLKQSITAGIQESVSAGMKSLNPASLGQGSRRPSDKEISHLTQEEKSILQRVWEKEEKFVEEETLRAQNKDKRKDSSAGTLESLQNCRICRRKLSVEAGTTTTVPYQKCSECGGRICEDCASYTNTAKNTQTSSPSSSSASSGGPWKCSLCRRKQSDQNQSMNLLGASESEMHRVPSMRRMATRLKQEAEEQEMKMKSQETRQTTEQHKPQEVRRLKADHPIPNGSKGQLEVTHVKKQLPNITRNMHPPSDIKNRRSSEGSCKTASGPHLQERWYEKEKQVPKGPSYPQNGKGSRPETSWSDRVAASPRTITNQFDHVKGKYLQKTPNHNPNIKSLSSASESSLDDHHHYREYSREDSDGWRRRRSRVRRRSRIQRQKNYDEDPDSDPTNNASNLSYHSRNSSSRDSWDSLDAVEYERDHGFTYGGAPTNSIQRHLLDVPSHRGEGTSSPNKYSSGSCSDVSDLSADFSSASSIPLSPYQHGRSVRKLPRPLSPRPGDFSDMAQQTSSNVGDTHYYDAPIFDSSPSSDIYSEERQFGYRYSQSSMTKSSSVEDTTFGEGLYAPAVSQRRSIPNLDSEQEKDISNQLCTRSWSYNFDIERDSKHDGTDEAYGQSLPAITVEESSRSVAGNKHYRHQNGVDRRSITPHETSRSLNLLTDNKLAGAGGRRSTLADCENIKIIVHDVDTGVSNRVMSTSPKRLVLSRNPEDRGHRTRGLGMRIVGGKIGSDGSLFAYVVWTVRGGPADRIGIKQGDKILEWDGISLVDKTFEEVCAIMDRSLDVVELLVEPSPDGLANDMDDSTADMKSPRARRQSESPDSDWSYPSSPTRRRLPKIPVEQFSSTSGPIGGELGIQLYYDGIQEQLTVVVVGARMLRHRRSAPSAATTCDLLPEAFVKLRLLPINLHGCRAVKTAVAKPSVDPQWKKTFIYTEILPDEVMDKTVELSVWDKTPDSAQSKFLGEVKIDLDGADINNHLIWYKLSPKQAALFSPVSSSVPVSPVFNYSQINSGNQVSRKQFSKSLSDDQGEILFNDEIDMSDGLMKSPSMDFSLRKLQNWEEDYGQKLSSTPNLTSTHSSGFTSKENRALQALTDNSGRHGVKNGSFKDQRQVWSDSERGDFQDKSRKKLSQKVKDKLAKTLILTRSDNPKRLVTLGTKEGGAQHASSRSSQSDVVDEQALSEVSTDDDNVSNEGQEGQENVEVKLGSGQVQPKDYRFDSITGFIQLSLALVKGTLEVDIIRAQKLKVENLGQPPDTYVKTYLRDDGKHSQKRKTRVVRRKLNPKYNQTLRYLGSESLGKNLVVMVWQRSKHLEHNKGIGVAQIELGSLRFNSVLKDWYLLFPMKSVVCVDNG